MKIPYSFLADLVLIIHALIAAFIAGGLLILILGAGLNWGWARNFWFRCTHLSAVIIIALQSWCKVYCPITNLEMYLRQKAGQPAYNISFVAYWLHRIIYYEAPFKVFSICYTLLALTVLLAWFFYPPRFPWNKTNGQN